MGAGVCRFGANRECSGIFVEFLGDSMMSEHLESD